MHNLHNLLLRRVSTLRRTTATRTTERWDGSPDTMLFISIDIFQIILVWTWTGSTIFFVEFPFSPLGVPLATINPPGTRPYRRNNHSGGTICSTLWLCYRLSCATLGWLDNVCLVGLVCPCPSARKFCINPGRQFNDDLWSAVFVAVSSILKTTASPFPKMSIFLIISILLIILSIFIICLFRLPMFYIPGDNGTVLLIFCQLSFEVLLTWWTSYLSFCWRILIVSLRILVFCSDTFRYKLERIFLGR